MSGGEPLLAVLDLHAGYGPADVLKGVSLEVRCGEIVTILGANGAGKTTLLSVVAGLLPARSGEVRFEGAPCALEAPHARVERGISLVPEGRRIFPRLSVRENLRLGAFTAPAGAFEAEAERMHGLFPILRERAAQLGGTLSGGEQQMLAIARGLMARPRLLLLDEPSLGLSPIYVQKVAAAVQEVRRLGVTVLLVEQNADLALRTSDRAYVLETGRIVLAGESGPLREDPRVKEAYLGG